MKLFIYLFMFLFLFNFVFADIDTIEFSTNQSEYYFLVNQNAILPLQVLNPYEKEIQGTFSLTMSYKQSQNGFTQMQSKSQSQLMTVVNDTLNLDFGTSNQPLEISLENIKFDYSYDDDLYQVSLFEIKIFFVENPNQQQNQENQQNSETKNQQQLEEEQKQQQEEQQKAEQEKRMQEQLNQQRNQLLQNNQLNQDSSALKKSLQEQQQKNEQIKEKFKENLLNNEEFKQKQNELEKQGFKQTNSKFDSESNSSGNFEMSYENKDGEKLDLKGKLDGENLQMNELSSQDFENIEKQLQQNSDFQDFQEYLKENSFNQSNFEYEQNIDKTSIKISYNNSNQNANVMFDYQNKTVQNLKFHKAKNKFNFFWLLTLLFIIPFLLFFKKTKVVSDISIKKEIPTDFVKESIYMLENAKKLFLKGEGKEAYAKVSQAVRFYLSYKFKIRKEISISQAFEFSKSYKNQKIRSCLSLTQLVEFAKYKANKVDFDKIIKYAEQIIK